MSGYLCLPNCYSKQVLLDHAHAHVHGELHLLDSLPLAPGTWHNNLFLHRNRQAYIQLVKNSVCPCSPC